MKFYKNSDNKVFAFEDEVNPENWIDDELTPINETEAVNLAKLTIPKDEIIRQLKDEQSFLINLATVEINILQDAIDLNMSTEEDKQRILDWKKYRVLVSKIDITSDNVDFPVKPT